MKLIVAVNNLGVIGNEGQIPWRCREDLKHFKAMTLHSDCLVGNTTYKGLPPLSNRTLIPVGLGGFSLEQALALNPDWVIGGASIYKQTVDLCDEIHISIINNDTPGDTYFHIPEGYKGKVFTYHFEPDTNSKVL
jgi:dihydrofolate reductase